MDTSGLSFEQAPPLRIPATFFVSAAVGVVVAGLLLAAMASTAILSPWVPVTIALTHVLTLGVIAMVMFGALYQMTPVVAGAAVPFVRSAYGVWGLLCIGAVGLVLGIARHMPTAAAVGSGALVCATLLFVVPVGVALVRAPARDTTLAGMRLAVLSFAAVAGIGWWMARGYAGGAYAMPRAPWIELHLVLALAGWVGGLIMAVSWQVIPMFYLAPSTSPAAQRLALGLLVLGIFSTLVVHSAIVLGFGESSPVVVHWRNGILLPLAATPAAISVGLIHPWLVTRALNARRRKRADASLLFWRVGMAVAPVALAAGVAATFGVARAALVFGWLALWGWAAMIAHGMLTRIVPFLVWFHRFSPLIGVQKIPSMRSMLPDPWIKRALVAHSAALVLGVAAIATGSAAMAVSAGVSVAATGTLLCRNLLAVLSLRPDQAEG